MMLLQLTTALGLITLAAARSPPILSRFCDGELEFQRCGTACPLVCGEPMPELCTTECVKGCDCPPGLWRTSDNRCVTVCPKPEKSIPQCNGDLVFMPCGSACENKCGEPEVEMCTEQCIDDVCQCPAGMWRTDDDRCVPQEQCPVVEPPKTCPKGLEFKECGSACENRCGEPEVEMCTKQCVPDACQCPQGLWRTADDDCIPKEQCPPVEPPTCPGELQRFSCGTACENKCGEPEVAFCTLQCIPDACQCPPGMWRTADDRCVEQVQCPVDAAKCPGELELMECGTACELFCGAAENAARDTGCIAMCVPNVCQCPPGMFRTKDDRCVQEAVCPSPEPPVDTCPGETIFKECGTTCEKKCGEPAPRICNKMCAQNVCQCPDDMWRTEDDLCVAKAECPAPKDFSDFGRFQEACRTAGRKECKALGCGRSRDKDSQCPVPATPKDIKCSGLKVDNGACARAGCDVKVKRGKKKTCKGTSKLSVTAFD